MAIKLRSRREIELLAGAGSVVADVLSKLKEEARPGVSTGDLNRIAEQLSAGAGARALFKGVKSPYARTPFPGAICASINEQVVHGIPSDKVRLRDGDILSIDFGVRLNGYCGDAAVTIGIGNVSPQRQRLMDVTKRLLDIAIEQIVPGRKWSRIARRMQNCAELAGFTVVTDFVGHGIGTQMHEEPKVPNFVSDELLNDDIVLAEGMILAVEPMVNIGTRHVKMLRDGWTVVAKDHKCSAHFEHTIAVVKNGCEVLTK
ncbi:MAG: type I methionyl aminopeptidase [Planctomycetes bacterium]|nr:type I methionyl aminopeptidase [Planctomycetota bacterium]